MNIGEKIRAAANGKQVNALLPDGVALIYGGKKLWCFTVNGTAQSFHEPFDDAKTCAARWVEIDKQ